MPEQNTNLEELEFPITNWRGRTVYTWTVQDTYDNPVQVPKGFRVIGFRQVMKGDWIIDIEGEPLLCRGVRVSEHPWLVLEPEETYDE